MIGWEIAESNTMFLYQCCSHFLYLSLSLSASKGGLVPAEKGSKDS